MPDLDAPLTTEYEAAAMPRPMAQTLPTAIRETIVAWGERNNKTLDVTATLRAFVVVMSDLITQTPDLTAQAQSIVYVEDALRYACSISNHARHPDGHSVPELS